GVKGTSGKLSARDQLTWAFLGGALWRHAAQLSYDAGQLLEEIIYVLVRVVGRETEPDRAPGATRTEPHRHQYVGRFDRAGGAGRPARGADARLIQQEEHGFRFDKIKGEAGRVRQTRFRRAVAYGLRNGAKDGIFHPVTQGAHAAHVRIQFGH